MIGRYKVQKKILNLFTQLLDGKDEILIWGAGEHTVALFGFLREKNISLHSIRGILSSYQEYEQIMGIPVYSLQEVLGWIDHIKYIVVSSYSFQNEILSELERNGLRSKAFVLYDIEKFDPLFYWKVGEQFYYNYEDIPDERIIHEVKLDNIEFKMMLNIREFIQNTIYNYGYYEEKETRFLSRQVQPGQTVFDLGANVGYYTLMFARRVGNSGAVHCFEPDNKNFRQLVDNI